MTDELKAALEQVASLEEVQARCQAALQRRPYWFPVRHHSPACARFLRQCIRQRQPRLILVEGPSEANHLLEHLIDKKTVPPVAIYSSFRSQDESRRCAAWFPLLEFSPEYVAAKTAREVGARVELIDLPHYTRPELAYSESLMETRFYHELVRRSGFRSFDETWDSLFEVGSFFDFEGFRAELALFCAAARATADPGRLRRDGTLEREHFMLRRIEAAGSEDTLVVTGGFHMFYDDRQAAPPPPQGTVYATLVPYSYPRVSVESGYAAGCRAPQFYERMWRQAAPVTTRYAVEVLREARRRGQPVSSADAIAATQTAALLGSLRRRSGVVLDDVNDALITCCCKGDPAQTGQPLLTAMAELARGERVGRVSNQVGQLPLLKDFHERLAEHELSDVVKFERWHEVNHDLRQRRDQRRSAFLHRLLLLEVPLGQRLELKAGLTLFQEKWRLRWNPGVTSALIENNLYGDTIQSAAAARMVHLMEQAGPQADVVSRLMVRWLGSDLPHFLSLLSRACAEALARDSRFLSLTEALGNLLRVEHHLQLTGQSDPAALGLVGSCFEFACAAMPALSHAPGDDLEAILKGLKVMLGVRLGDRALYESQLTLLARGARSAWLRGAAWGLLVEQQAVTPASVAAELMALARAPADILVTAGEFLEGLLAASRAAVLLEPAALVAALDELLQAASWDDFLVMLPRLRCAMDRAGERAVHSLAGEVAQRYGLRSPLVLDALPRGLNLCAVRIDEQVSRIMAEWEGA